MSGVTIYHNPRCGTSRTTLELIRKKGIEPKVIEDVAREFQLDEVEPIAPPASARQDGDVFQSEAFIQNLGEALSRFRMSPSVPSSTRERK